MAGSQQIAANPLFKWPGGKRALLPNLLCFVPEGFDTYYEPFSGAAALFFALAPHKAVLGDTNAELINCYLQLRDNPEQVISRLRRMKNNEEEYYQIRKSRPRTEVGRAARLIYLVTLSFNGIYRVNLAGNFNVPYGYKRHINVCQPDAIHLASKLLQRTEVICSDFAEVVADAAKGDFVYFDPPYTVNGAVNGFRKYNARLFSWDDQVRLASVAIDLAQRGCHVLVSNANHPEVRDLYNGFVVKNVQRFSRIAALSKHRRIITEYLFFSERR